MGAFNGLMFMPVLLSLIGPPPDTQEVIEAYEDEKLFSLIKRKQQMLEGGHIPSFGN